jgi:hypothetical protein
MRKRCRHTVRTGADDRNQRQAQARGQSWVHSIPRGSVCRAGPCGPLPEPVLMQHTDLHVVASALQSATRGHAGRLECRHTHSAQQCRAGDRVRGRALARHRPSARRKRSRPHGLGGCSRPGAVLRPHERWPELRQTSRERRPAADHWFRRTGASSASPLSSASSRSLATSQIGSWRDSVGVAWHIK